MVLLSIAMLAHHKKYIQLYICMYTLYFMTVKTWSQSNLHKGRLNEVRMRCSYIWLIAMCVCARACVYVCVYMVCACAAACTCTNVSSTRTRMIHSMCMFKPTYL